MGLGKRIAFEVTGAMGGGGYRRYAESLVAAMAEADPSNEYLLFGSFWKDFPARARRLDFPKAPNVRWALARRPQQVLLPAEEWLGVRASESFLLRRGAQILHGLGTWLPPLERIPGVVTLHFSGLKERATAWDRFYYDTLARRSMERAGRIVSISRYCMDEAIGAWHLPEEKFRVIPYGGAGPQFRAATGEERSARAGDLPYFLFVGPLKRHKNVVLLARAFADFARRRPDLPHRVVFAGPPGNETVKVLDILREAGVEGRAVFPGAVPPAEIPALYRGAFAVVCPSPEEGFALPVIEGMASSAPVIGVDAGAIPETMADAGLVCGLEPAAMADAMVRLASEPTLRDALVAKGLARAREFSWRETARRTLAVYAELL